MTAPFNKDSLWIHTMNRCKTHTFAKRATRMLATAVFASVAAGATLLAASPAHAQYGAMAVSEAPRPFPPTALFGTLIIDDANRARINGKPIRIAPGMRLLNQHNHMLPYVQASGQRMRVRYQTEASTGMLQMAWLLRDSEMPPRRWFGLFGPDTQDPHEVQTGPLGVGVAKSTGSAANTPAPATRSPVLGQTPIQGQNTIQGVNVTPRH